MSNPLQYYYQILRTSFINNQAKKSFGGGISLRNIKSLLIEDSNFIGNYAEVKGGGIYFSCNEVDYDCKL